MILINTENIKAEIDNSDKESKEYRKYVSKVQKQHNYLTRRTFNRFK